MADTDEVLLRELNAQVAGLIIAESLVKEAQAKLVSRSKEIGLLVLEAKKRHPKVADFEAFLKGVNGLKLSRAYDLMALAGGRKTDAELREETRERVRKHRAKKKLPKPEPVSVTDPDVTESSKRITQSPEITAEERRAQNAALDAEPAPTPPEPDRSPDEKGSRRSAIALNEFKLACKTYLPRLTSEDWVRASNWWDEYALLRNQRAKAA
jgi:hypothetical protein